MRDHAIKKMGYEDSHYAIYFDLFLDYCDTDANIFRKFYYW